MKFRTSLLVIIPDFKANLDMGKDLERDKEFNHGFSIQDLFSHRCLDFKEFISEW